MINTWFSGCHHFGHSNILHLADRKFNDIFEHDRVLIENHNSVVSKEDDCYFLGDFSYRCSAEYTVKMINSLNFKKLFIIMGNHSKPLRQAFQNGLLDSYIGKIFVFGGQEAIEDQTLSISKMIEINGQKIFLSHYPYHSFPNAFRNSIMLHSHCHNRVKSPYRRMDIGVDTFSDTHKRYFPWSFEEVKAKMDAITIEFSET